MELFYIVTFVIMSQTNIVHGVHADASSATAQTYQGQSNFVDRTLARSRSRLFSPPHTANRGIPRRGRPRFIHRNSFQRPRSDLMAFRTYRRNYPTLQNRNIIQPILSQPLARPLVYRSPVHFHQRPPTLRRFDMRNPTEVTHINENDRTLNNIQRPRIASGNLNREGLQQSEKNSLLTLLEERRPVIRDENDLLLIRKYLIEINSVESNAGLEGLDKDQILQKQVECIENIRDVDVQREVLKIFVKDVVEKSGFLSENASSVQDINSLKGLVDKISSITDKFTKLSQNSGIDPFNVIGEVQVVDSGLGKSPTTTNRPTTSSDTVRQRIINALSIYDRTDRAVPNVHSDYINRRLETFQGRQRHPRVGMSVFGDLNMETTTPHLQTTEIKRDFRVTEPLGGNNAYWTHLRAGLVDMLCNLCRQQDLDICIIRYCTNDGLIRTETETPAPPVSITAA